MKRKIRLTGTVLVSAITACALFTGCGNSGSATAFTINGEKVPFGEANFMLRTNQAEVYYMMASSLYGSGSVWDEEFTPEGEEQPVKYGDYFKDQIKSDYIKLVLQRQKAGEYGVALDDEDKQKTETLAKEFMESNADIVDDLGCTYDYVLEVLQLNALKPKMREALSVDVDTNVSDEEADMCTVSYLRIPIPNEEEAAADTAEAAADTAEAAADTAEAEAADTAAGESEEAPAKTKEELFAEAEEVLKLYKEAGDLDYDSLNEIGDSVDEDFFGMVYSFAPDETPFTDPVMEAYDTLKDGEVYDGVIDEGDYYYVVRLEKRHDPEKIEEKKQQIIEERKTEMYNSTLDEWVGAADVTEEKIWTDTVVSDKDAYVSTQFLNGQS